MAQLNNENFNKTKADTYPAVELVNLSSAIGIVVSCSESSANKVSFEFINSGNTGEISPGEEKQLTSNSDAISDQIQFTWSGPAEIEVTYIDGAASGGGGTDISNRLIGKIVELANDDGGTWVGYPIILQGDTTLIIQKLNGEAIPYNLGANINVPDDLTFANILNALQGEMIFAQYVNLEELLVNSGSTALEEIDFIEINADVGQLIYSPSNFLTSPDVVSSIIDQMNERQKVIEGYLKGLYRPLYSSIEEGFPAIITRPTDYDQEVAMGRVSRATTWNKFGYNTDVDTAAPEIIASFGGTFNIMTTADTIEVVSTSANDTAAGTGARTVLITGINSLGAQVQEQVTLNGVTGVTTITQFLGINRVVVLSSGTSNTNEGTISFTDSGGTFGIQAEIPIGSSVTQQAIFHTQAGYRFCAYSLLINCLKIAGGGGSPRVTINGYSYSRVTETVYSVFKVEIDTSIENTVPILQKQPFVIGGNEVLYFEATTDVNNTSVDLRFSGIEELV